MIAELGHFALILSLCLALFLGVVPLLGAGIGMVSGVGLGATYGVIIACLAYWSIYNSIILAPEWLSAGLVVGSLFGLGLGKLFPLTVQRPNWMKLARPLAAGLFVFVTLAFVMLSWAFVENDFSVAYVAANSNLQLPLMYRLSAVWGAHEGSLLLWMLMLAGWTVAVAAFSAGLPMPLLSRVLGVLGLVSVGFLLFMLMTSNPFERHFPAPLNGRELNPLLQDPGLVIHPPMLYMGYVGFSVAFAFAVAAMIGDKLDSVWLRWVRPWTTMAWVFLTLGIMLGSWWAYNELGWGGWWFWDPVENASFMPWLVGTALIHSLAVAEKRGVFRNVSLLLAILAFSFSLLGTFLVRSGVLVSVHAFATDPTRGVFILGYLCLVIFSALTLFACKAHRFHQQDWHFHGYSRETLLMLNNVFMGVLTLVVLWGTLFPLVQDALGRKVSVGPQFFDQRFVVFGLPLLVLLGIGSNVRWKKGDWQADAKRLLIPAGLSMALAAVIVFWQSGEVTILALAGVALGVWCFSTALLDPIKRLRTKSSMPGAVLGQSVAHAGMGLFVIGVTMVHGYGIEQDVRLAPGETLSFQGYDFTMAAQQRIEGPNYRGMSSDIAVSKDGQTVATLIPEKRQYVTGSPMTEASVDIGLRRDVYVAMGEPLDNEQTGMGAWSFRLYVKPYIRWIWFGAVLMALGGVLAVADKRYRARKRQPVSKKPMAVSTTASTAEA